MTLRTFSLLSLFLVGLLLAAVLTAGSQRIFGASAPTTVWIVPVAAFVGHTFAFFVGRKFVLPHDLARAPLRAFATIAILVGSSIAVVVALVWAAQVATPGVPGVIALALWFTALWLGFGALHRAAGHQRWL